MSCSDFDCIFLRIPPQEIAYLKFTIESYEELGIVRTLNPDLGEVVIMAPSDSITTLSALLEELAADINLQIIPPPLDSVNGDWLLAEYYGGLKAFV